MYGLLQHHGMDPLPWQGDVTTRIASTMGNPIFVGAYLIMVIPLTLGRLLEALHQVASERPTASGHRESAVLALLMVAQVAAWALLSFSQAVFVALIALRFWPAARPREPWLSRRRSPGLRVRTRS